MTTRQSIWQLWIIILLLTNAMMFAKELIVRKLIEGLHKPVFLTAPLNNSDTLFVVEQHGVIRSVINGELLSKPILEINPSHAIIRKMKGMKKSKSFDDISQLLLDQAVLLEGAKLQNPTEFVERLNTILTETL